MTQILIIDDDPHFTRLVGIHLRSKNLEVITAETLKGGLEALKSHKIDLIFLDIYLPDGLGVDFIPNIKTFNHIPIIMVSRSEETAHIVKAIKVGASDYIQKPVAPEVLWEKIYPLLEMQRTKSTEKELHSTLVGQSPAIRQVLRDMSKMANSDAAVLLRGESGTGKSLIAKMIHSHSPRKEKPFITINCPAIPDNLLESELFGHEKGAFTGAVRDKQGKFEIAHGGTIFLDEIGDLSIEMQAKILRVIQGHEFERVGGLKTIKADVRIIAATNRNLEQAMLENRFREDLFYRLNVLPLVIPSLRERREDIPILIDYFLQQFCKKSNKHFEKLSPQVIQYLSEYSWPGNIREMQNVIERAIVIGQEPNLRQGDFIIQKNQSIPSLQKPKEISEKTSSLKEMEHRELMKALEQSGGSITKASTLLGIGRGAIYRRLKKYHVQLKREEHSFR